MKKNPRYQRSEMSSIIDQILDQDTINLGFTIEYEKNGQTVQHIFSTSDVVRHLCTYYTYSFFRISSDNPGFGSAFNSDLGYFLYLWTGYLKDKNSDFVRIAQAYDSEYNPISNYSMRDQETEGRKIGDETRSFSGTDTLTTTGKGVSGVENGDVTTVDGYGDRVTERDMYKNGLGSTVDGKHSDREITTESGTTSSDQINQKIERKTDAELDFDESSLTGYQKTGSKAINETAYGKNETISRNNEKELSPIAGNTDISGKYAESKDRYFTREGNIGVTTSQHMISEELELRYKNYFLRDIVSLFANQNLVYIGGEYCDNFFV